MNVYRANHPGGPPQADVPCNGCTACCRNEMVILHPEHGDDPDRYMTKITTNPIIGGQAYALRNKPNGDCIYLGDTGCTIHAWRPAMCRAYDCRRMYERFMQLPRAERRRALRQNWIDQPKLDVGKRMLELERAALLDDE